MTEKSVVLQRLAAIVRRRRKARGWSQQNLARLSGTNRDVIKRLEKGANDTRSSVVFRVLPILGCTGKDLQRIMHGRARAA